MTMKELFEAVKKAHDYNKIPEGSEIVFSNENGKTAVSAVIKNVKFADGTLHTINHKII